ncbi:alpha/beta hydrolase [Paenibacillus sp. RC67]|uniref:alpha/beta hydrolase n=1 Tax=Paenibacillus sp. RC67 TaxID=3039392 RepID=UPI0024AC99BF|nr:alpha/beta hydrolase [Paenibacillus sp. RC67]
MRYLDTCFSEVDIVKDILFSEAINVQGDLDKLKLDIYTPTDDKEMKRPAIIWIHGGGFRPGKDKSQNYIVEFAKRFALKGYVCVAPDYRVRENPRDDFKGTMSDALSDASCALDWVRNNSKKYGVDTQKLFIAGGSAGGMIAVNLCYGDGTYGRQPDRSGVQAMLNLWGSPKDLHLDVHSNSIPALTIHGTADEIIKFENSCSFTNRLNEAGVKSVFLPLDGAPHTPIAHMEYMDSEFSRFLIDILVGSF